MVRTCKAEDEDNVEIGILYCERSKNWRRTIEIKAKKKYSVDSKYFDKRQENDDGVENNAFEIVFTVFI